MNREGVFGFYKKTNTYKFKFEEEGTACRIIPLGYARTDVLCKKLTLPLEKIFGKKFNKVIVWCPTFRP